MAIPIILDTDIGTDIDDTWALTMLLSCRELDPKLLLTANDGRHHLLRQADARLRTLHRAGNPIPPETF